MSFYIRWTITKIRSATYACQAAEFTLYDSDTKVSWPKGTTVSSNLACSTSEAASNLIDGYTNYKACTTNWGGNQTGNWVITFTLPSNVDFTSYTYTTANDDYRRDPISWTLEISDDGSKWVTVSTVNDYAVTSNRKEETGKFAGASTIVTLTVYDKYYDIDGTLDHTSTRVQTYGKGSTYTVNALTSDEYRCDGTSTYTGQINADTELTFIYKPYTYTIKVYDKYYTLYGSVERQTLRQTDVYLKGDAYSYEAFDPTGYIVLTSTTISGVATADRDIVFEYKPKAKAGVFSLIALDKDFGIVSLLRPTNVQWTRKYREAGTFSVQIPLDQYDPNIKYVYTKARPEVGKVSQINYQEKNGYRYMSLSGYFLENELDRHIVYKKGTTNITNDPGFDNATGTGEDVAYAYFNGFKSINGKNIDGQTWSSNLGIQAGTNMHRGHSCNHHRNGEKLGYKIYWILKPSGMSYRVAYNFETSSNTFEVWTGLDRSQGNTDGNNPVIFSTRYGNVKNPNILIDDSTYANAAIVTSEYVAASDSEYTIQAYNDMTDTDTERVFVSVESTLNKAEYTTTTFAAELETEGKNKVNNSDQTINLDFDAMAGSYEYLTDFDLGDLCSIEIPEVGFSADARLIGIYEVIKSNDWSISLEFGTPIINS